MSRENPDSEYLEEQEHISNPDLFLSLGKPEGEETPSKNNPALLESKEVKKNKKEEAPEQIPARARP
jgi:hypothetical protein